MFGVELAAMKQQRRCAFAVAAAFNFANKNHVIAFQVTASVKAFKASCGASQKG